ncbi:hypothetical protein BJV74DRAFT_516394 [Russula compacta]|nr:hypothetical protein BJV74DRAFT_516394 [Russula compacta]
MNIARDHSSVSIFHGFAARCSMSVVVFWRRSFAQFLLADLIVEHGSLRATPLTSSVWVLRMVVTASRQSSFYYSALRWWEGSLGRVFSVLPEKRKLIVDHNKVGSEGWGVLEGLEVEPCGGPNDRVPWGLAPSSCESRLDRDSNGHNRSERICFCKKNLYV